MHFQEPVQEPVGTIDSIELINRAGVIRKIQGTGQTPVNKKADKGAPKQDKEESKKGKGGTQTIPKEVRFDIEQVEEAAKGEARREGSIRRDSEDRNRVHFQATNTR